MMVKCKPIAVRSLHSKDIAHKKSFISNPRERYTKLDLPSVRHLAYELEGALMEISNPEIAR